LSSSFVTSKPKSRYTHLLHPHAPNQPSLPLRPGAGPAPRFADRTVPRAWREAPETPCRALGAMHRQSGARDSISRRNQNPSPPPSACARRQQHRRERVAAQQPGEGRGSAAALLVRHDKPGRRLGLGLSDLVERLEGASRGIQSTHRRFKAPFRPSRLIFLAQQQSIR
jgi:hypothetical protein